jgi:hypothetical protein
VLNIHIKLSLLRKKIKNYHHINKIYILVVSDFFSKLDLNREIEGVSWMNPHFFFTSAIVPPPPKTGQQQQQVDNSSDNSSGNSTATAAKLLPELSGLELRTLGIEVVDLNRAVSPGVSKCGGSVRTERGCEGCGGFGGLVLPPCGRVLNQCQLAWFGSDQPYMLWLATLTTYSRPAARSSKCRRPA